MDPTDLGAISRVQIARYAGAVGDFNPVHVDEQFAKAAGQPSVIAHGPLTVTLALEGILREHGGGRLRKLDARLKAPVFPGDELQLVCIQSGRYEVRKSDGTVAVALTVER